MPADQPYPHSSVVSPHRNVRGGKRKDVRVGVERIGEACVRHVGPACPLELEGVGGSASTRSLTKEKLSRDPERRYLQGFLSVLEPTYGLLVKIESTNFDDCAPRARPSLWPDAREDGVVLVLVLDAGVPEQEPALHPVERYVYTKSILTLRKRSRGPPNKKPVF